MTTPVHVWHVPDRDLARYAAGAIDPVSATSTESHLVRCSECQARLGREVRTNINDTVSDATWAAITDVIDRPTATRRRLLGRLEQRHPLSTVTLGSPALRWSGALALALVMLVPVLLNEVGLSGAGMTLFFVLAPLVPLAGIAASYSVAVEPVGELAFATPARTMRLLLWRGLTVLAVSLPLGALAAIPLAAPPGFVLGWILPALALCAITLAAATWRDPVPVAVGLAVAWAAAVVLMTVGDGRSAAAITRDLVAWAPTLQAVSLAVLAAGAAVTFTRRDAFEQGRLS